MRILILGGTVFVGRHLADAALQRGHTLTLFNRGQHNPDLYPEVEKLRGDRDGGLAVLEGRRWDAVIDTCGYAPRIVRQSAELLANAVDHYTFISTINVYKDYHRPRMEESAPLADDVDPTEETFKVETYGPLKTLCERAVEAVLPGRTLISRSGLIVGPLDPARRFIYWPLRTARGGEVLVPGTPDQPLQFIDMRDQAEWILRMVEAGSTGTYNVLGPDYPLTMQRLLEESKAVTGSDVRFTYVPASFLRERDTEPNALNFWHISRSDETIRQIWNIANAKAIAAGLTFRPLAETIRDTLAWDATVPAENKRPFGLEPERERELLALWSQQSAG